MGNKHKTLKNIITKENVYSALFDTVIFVNGKPSQSKSSISDFEEIFLEVLKTYNIRKPLTANEGKWCSVERENKIRPDADAFENIDMAMAHWLYSHKVVVAYFQRKVIKYDSKGVETVLMAYTKFKGRFVILRSFQNQSTDFVLSTTCLADEFTVEKSCENFVIHPFNLSLKKKLNDARTKEGTK